uniref:Uncharacterized protein n=1 Tax=Histophilus somni (strain 129Pt) TaxID=205914 RepID=Q0I3Z2_HISS1
MNKIFKTKYDVTTGQTKVVSELANNRQVASRVDGSSVAEKCGDFLGNFLGAFKVLPLALLMSGLLSSVAYAKWIVLDNWNKIGDENGLPVNDTVYLGVKGNNDYGSPKGAGNSVIIGFRNEVSSTGTEKVKLVIIGNDNSALGSQSVAVGSEVHATAKQATAVGNNVVAGGVGSIAIGSDDVDAGSGKFKDKFTRGLPKSIYDKYKQVQNTAFANLAPHHDLFKDGGNGQNSSYSPTWAKGTAAIALGGRSVAYGDGSLAVGTLSIAEGNLSTAIGSNSGAFADYSQAIGSDTFIYAENSVGVGSNIQVLKKGGMAYGYNANSGGEGSIAIGTDVSANTKIKYDVTYKKVYGQTNAHGEISEQFRLHPTEQEINKQSLNAKSILVHDLNGSAKVAGSNKPLESGSYFGAEKSKGYIDLLEEAIAGSDPVLDITQREQGTGIQKIQSNDGKNGIAIGSKSGAIGSNSMAFGRGTFSKSKNAISIGSYSYNIGENTIAIGLATKGLAKNSVILGVGSGVEFGAENSTVIGTGSAVFKKNSAILGAGSRVWGESGFLIGNDSDIAGDDNIVLGSSTKIIADNDKNKSVNKSIAIGKDVELKPTETENNTSSLVVIGNEAKGYFSNSVALGYRSETDYDANDLDKPAYMPDGSLSIPSSKKTGIVSVGRKGAERRITNVAGGFLNTDAVNVFQLRALEDKINSVNLDSSDLENTRNVPYYAIKLTEKVQDPQTKKVAWKKYVELQKMQKVLDNRKKNNDETFDRIYEANLAKEIDKLEKAYTDFKTQLGNEFKSLNIEQGENESQKREKFKSNNDQIERIANNLAKKDVVTQDEKTKAQESNYTSQLAYGQNSMALGYKAQAGKLKSKNTEATGNNALAIGIEAKALENNTTAIGYKASANEDGAIALGANSVADTASNIIGFDTVTGANRTNVNTPGAWKSKYGALSIGNIEKNKKGVITGYNTRQITGLAAGTQDTDAVNVAQLKNATLHFMSINAVDEKNNKGTTTKAKDKFVNYANNGATGKNSIAIGVGATSTAENAVAIGTNASIDIPNSFVMGANNVVNQQDRDVRSAVVVIGSGIKLEESKSSIAIGAVFVERNGNKDGVIIENAAWAASIGNKNKIKNGTDIIALGNNIDIGYDYDTNSHTSKNNSTDKMENTEVIAIGNRANAKKAKGSVLIGVNTKVENAQSAVVIGKGASATTVNSVAIGSGSKTTGDITTKGYDPSTSAAYSATDTKDDYKWLPTAGEFAIGDINRTEKVGGKNEQKPQTRRITGLAAGNADTDAVNVAQLKKVVGGAAKLKYATNQTGNDIFTATNEYKEVDLQTKGLHFKNGDSINITADNDGAITIGLDSTTKGKINGALSKTEAESSYEKKITKANLNGGTEIQVDGSGKILDSALTLSIKAGSISKTKLDQNLQSEINEKATTASLNSTKTELENKINQKVDAATFTTKMGEKADKSLSNIDTIGENKIKGLVADAVDVQGTTNEINVTNSTTNNKKTFTVALAEDIKTKLNGALTETTANNKYAKVDASNITADTWRTKLNVYSKEETTTEINKAKETVTNGTGIDVTASNGNDPKTFTVALNSDTQAKLGNIGTGEVSATENNKTVTGAKVHNAIEAAKTGLYANTATFGLTDDNSKSVTKKLNETISIKGSSTAKSGGTNISVSVDSESNTSGLKIELGETLSGIKKISNGKTEITLDDTNGVQIKHGGGTSSKLVNEGGFNNLSGGDEIKVTGGGKVFGGATSLSLNANSIDGSKLKNNTITETQLAQDVTNKLNKEFKVKTGSDTSSNLIGETLEFKGDSYITPKFDSGDKSITYTLNVAESLDDTQSSTGGTQNGAQAQDGAAGTQGNTLSKKLVSADAVKNYVNSKISSYSSTLGLEADNTSSDTNNPKGKVDLKTTSLKISGDGNISTSVSNKQNTISIKLNEALKNITSIASKEEYETDTPSTKAAAKSIITLGNDLTLANTGKSFTIKSDHILSDNEIYVGIKDDSNKLVKQSELTSKISEITKNTTNISSSVSTLSANTITFKDGSDGMFERANNSDKNVVFKGEGNLNVKLSTDTSNVNTGIFTISVDQTNSINEEAGKTKQKDGTSEKETVPDKLTTEKAVVDYVQKVQNSLNEAITNNNPKGEIKDKIDTSTEKIKEELSKAKPDNKEEKKKILNKIGIVDTKEQENILSKEGEEQNKEIEKAINKLVKDDSSQKAVSGDTVKKYLTQNYYNKEQTDNMLKNVVYYDSNKKDKITLGGALDYSGKAKGVLIDNLAKGEISKDSRQAINGSQLNELATQLGIDVYEKTGFKTIAFNKVKGDNSNAPYKTYKDAIDGLITAVNGGITLKGNKLTDNNNGIQKLEEATLQLGDTISIESSQSNNGKSKDTAGKLEPKKDDDIEISVKQDDTNNKKTLTLILNKSTKVSEDDERVVTSSAVKKAIDEVQKATDANNPFKTTYKDETGSELEKHGDKFYKKDEIPEGSKYDPTKGKFVDENGAELSDDKQPKVVKNDKVKEEINLKGNTPKKIANVDSGLGLKKYQDPTTGNLDDEAKNKEIAKAKENHQKAKKDAIDKLLGNNADKANNIDSDPMLNNVATIRDLQALGQAGLDFAGNDTATSVHRNLGQKLVIKGDQDAPAGSFESAKDNINVAVEGEALVVQLSKNLKNLTSAEFTSEETNSDGAKQKFKTTINGKGTTIVELGDDGNVKENGKKAEYTLDGTKVTDGKNTFVTTAIETKLTTEKGDTTSITGNAITLKGKDGKPTLATLNKDGLTVGDSTNADDKTHAVYGKDGFTVKGKDGSTEAISLKVTEKDGKETATLAFGKDANGKYIGAITGLADLDDGADGSSVVNKNFVKNEVEKLDQKLSSANTNKPFDYYLDNEKVVKGQDGQFYKPDELKGATYVAGTTAGDKGKYTKKNAQGQDEDIKSSIADKQSEVVIKAEPKAMVVSNIADGALSADSKDAINGGQLIKATGAKWIDDPSASETAPKPKIMVFADGKDGLSGLEKTSDGKGPMAAKGLTDKDGLNGKNANDKANALRNGEAGAVVFTDSTGNRLVKAKDGKYYKATDVNADGSVKKTDGQDAPKPVDTPQLSLVNHEGEATKPVVLGNVASGLGISAITESEKQSLTKAVKEKTEELETTHNALQTAKDQVGKKQQELEAANNVLSQMAIERPALLMMQAEIEQQLKGLSATDPQRATAQAMLNKVKEALTKNDQNMTKATKTVSEASAALDQAKIALADNVLKAYAAQQALANAEEALQNKENGVDKVQALLSDNSGIAEANVVTVKDLKAVAKAGLNFEGNDGKRAHKDLSETLAIKGEENASGDKFNSNHTASGNIKVEMAQDGKGLEVKLSDQLKNLTSVETKKDDQGRSTALLSRGVMVQNDTAKEQAQLSENNLAFFENDGVLGLNLDGKSRALRFGTKEIIRINEAGEALVSNLNASSSGQAIANKTYVDSQVGAAVNRLDNVISTNNRTLQAGIAGANAAAALPTVTMPGKSTIALSAGTYKGRNAVAIGYSRLSDNGKITLKLQGNSNSAGDFGGGVGVGWTW